MLGAILICLTPEQSASAAAVLLYRTACQCVRTFVVSQALANSQCNVAAFKQQPDDCLGPVVIPGKVQHKHVWTLRLLLLPVLLCRLLCVWQVAVLVCTHAAVAVLLW